MNIQKHLEKGHSLELTNQLVSYVGGNSSRFEELMHIVLGENKMLAQRASWTMSFVGKKHYELFSLYLDRILKLIQSPKVHDAVIRHTLKVLEQTSIPEERQSEVVDMCLAFVCDASKPAAIKAFSITILENMCVKYPELVSEIASVLKDRIEFEKPAFKVRAKRFLNRFK